MNPGTLRLWKKRSDVDAGRQPETTSEAQAEIKRFKRQSWSERNLPSCERVSRHRPRPHLAEII
jgi:hypothetical protein